MKLAKMVWLLLIPALLLVAAGCKQPTDGYDDTTGDANGDANGAVNGDADTNGDAMASEDVAHAEALWAEIKGYEEWPVPEDFQGWQEGKSPHGAVLRYYVNETAREDLTADGAVIVKENYSDESDDALKSVTIMEKREGYDPETGNWFYVKYSPEGEIMKNPKGMPLAGLVGKGMEKGCVPCHAAAGDDYLFMNDE